MIESIDEISTDDVILVRFPVNVYDECQISKIYKMVKDVFCDNDVIMVPKDVSFEKMTIEELKNIMSQTQGLCLR